MQTAAATTNRASARLAARIVGQSAPLVKGRRLLMRTGAASKTSSQPTMMSSHSQKPCSRKTCAISPGDFQNASAATGTARKASTSA